jgi:hypothetical protein
LPGNIESHADRGEGNKKEKDQDVDNLGAKLLSEGDHRAIVSIRGAGKLPGTVGGIKRRDAGVLHITRALPVFFRQDRQQEPYRNSSPIRAVFTGSRT